MSTGKGKPSNSKKKATPKKTSKSKFNAMYKMWTFAFGIKPVRGQENYFKKWKPIRFLALSHILRRPAAFRA
jgi:hypothetical protein